MAEGVYIRQTTSAHVITTIVTLPGMNHAWASAKQLDPYSEMKLQYLYFHLLYSILGLKCNIYITLQRVFLILNIQLWVRVYFTVCFKAEKQDYHELCMETKF